MGNGNYIPRDKLPQFDERKIKILAKYGWWDGLLSGIIEHDNIPYWTDYCGDCPTCDKISCEHESGKNYFYKIYPITETQIQEFYQMEDKEEYIGPDLANIDPIGWFMDGYNQNFYAIVVHKKDCNGNCNCAIGE